VITLSARPVTVNACWVRSHWQVAGASPALLAVAGVTSVRPDGAGIALDLSDGGQVAADRLLVAPRPAGTGG